jgi:transcriptional regulator with XRE-family HTH domain
MTRINPVTLKAARDSKKWSLDDLARKSRIDKQSIHRIEKGEKKRNRRDVVKKLSDALGITADALTNPTAKFPVIGDSQVKTVSESQLNLRVSDRCRNALALTAIRYKVTQSHITEIAPFLFSWAAELSLKRRQERLDAVETNDAERAALSAPHLHDWAFNNFKAEKILDAEKVSIKSRDIFGRMIDGDDFESHLSESYDETTENPFSQFMSEVAEHIGAGAGFTYWHPDGSPDYEVAREQALALLNDDNEAARLVLSGCVALHQLPDHLKKKASGSDRAKWVHEKWAENPLSTVLSDLDL